MNNNRVIFFIDYFLPGYKFGGPVKSLSNLINAIGHDYHFYVFTRNTDFNETNSYKNKKPGILYKNKKFMISYEEKLSFIRLLEFIRLVNPAALWLNSFFSILSIRLLLLSRFGFLNKPLALSIRGELSPGALSLKPYKKKFYIFIFKYFLNSQKVSLHVTSDEEYMHVKNLFPTAPIYQIPNISDTEINYSKLSFKKNHLKLLYLSRVTPKKNLLFALKILVNKKIIVPNITFDIYGPIEDKNYFNQCLKITKTAPQNIKIKYLGDLHPSKVSYVLKQYNCFFLPTLSENYGHSIVEAMQAGLVPIISDQTPWKFSNKYLGGFSISLSDKEKFIDSINFMGTASSDEFNKLSKCSLKYIQNKVNPSIAIKSYNELLSKLISS